MIFLPILLSVALFVLNFSLRDLFIKDASDRFACQSLISRAHGETIGFSENASNYIDLQLFFDTIFFTICNCWKSFLQNKHL
jgi:hypothetical protein